MFWSKINAYWLAYFFISSRMLITVRLRNYLFFSTGAIIFYFILVYINARINIIRKQLELYKLIHIVNNYLSIFNVKKIIPRTFNRYMSCYDFD